MKTVNLQKRHAAASGRQKSASGMNGRIGRAHGIIGSKRRLRRNPVGRAGKLVSRLMRKEEHKVPLVPERRVDLSYQNAVRNFEMGVRVFHRQNYERAAEIFQKLVDVDAREVAERAKVHLRLCKQRISRAGPVPKSADEYYALGIVCLNAGDVARAIENLRRADKLKPNQDHVQYALAAGHALRGDADAAFLHLETAFNLRPENRIHARRDHDFQGLAADPRFHRLVYPARV